LSTVISSFVTITCDNQCGKTITFPQTEEAEKEAFHANPWMNALRFITTADQRKYIYCSDECEAKQLGTGIHNKKLLIAPTGPNSVDLAAQAAARARQATEQIKAGNPVTLS
jgi:hypothetical protein